MNKGFTLIELLVVVLIIGILAAIALPQYTKAVERSRMAEAVQLLGDAATAESIAYMQDGAYTDDPSTGDVQVNLTDNENWDYTATPTAAAGETKASVVITAQRLKGMYTGGTLSLKIDDTGKIEKICSADGNTTGFCAAAKAMGYGDGSVGTHTI